MYEWMKHQSVLAGCPAHVWHTRYPMRAIRIYAFLYFVRDPGRNRTCDPLIKSQLLYQLSYGTMPFSK